MAIDRSAFAGTDLDQAMQTMAQSVLDRTASILQMFDRSQEPVARTHDNVIVDNYHFDVDGTNPSTIPVASRSDEKADYQTPTEFSLSQQTWKIDKGGENSFKMYTNDIARSQRGRQRILDGAERMRQLAVNNREDDLISYLGSLTTYTTNAPVAADLPKLDNTGDNGNAGKIHATTIGASTNTVDNDTGALNGNAAAQLTTANAIVNDLTNLAVRVTRRHVVQGQAVGPTAGPVGLVCPPEFARAIIDSMQLLDLHSDQINQDTFRDMSLFTSAPLSGVLKTLPFASHTAFPLPASATAGFTGYLMAMNAVQYAENFVNFWSQAPTSSGGVNPGPYFSYHQHFEWGRKLINPEFIIKVTLRTA